VNVSVGGSQSIKSRWILKMNKVVYESYKRNPGNFIVNFAKYPSGVCRDMQNWNYTLVLSKDLKIFKNTTS
jgi:hypothetical protein